MACCKPLLLREYSGGICNNKGRISVYICQVIVDLPPRFLGKAIVKSIAMSFVEALQRNLKEV